MDTPLCKSHEKAYVKDYNHNYYSKNKTKWLEKVHCDTCHLDVCRASWKKHNQSRQHQRLYTVTKQPL